MQSWEKFLAQQEKELGVETVNRWLRSLKITHFDARNLYLEAKDTFQFIWFEEHIRKILDASFVNNNNKPIKVHLALPQSPLNQPAAKKGKNSRYSKSAYLNSMQEKFTLVFDQLDPILTFSNFVNTESNLLAYKLLCKVTNYDPASEKCVTADNELAAFNPIYLYGESGSGKTHLLLATAHALKMRGLHVIYVRSQTFTEHVVSAIRAGEMSLFREAYRNIDILLIDDVHVFSRKGATQEELFHTFNTLHLAGKQIILSANCSPAELQFIEPRLVSRFEWGIVLPLEPTSDENLIRILQRKTQALKFPLHPKVQEFLVTTFASSPKAMIQALEALILRIHLKKQNFIPSQLTVPIVKEILTDMIQQEELAAITPDRIVQTVSEFFGIPSEDLFSKSQSREAVLPRQIAMHFCRSRLNMPFTHIGDLFGRDHSTAMSSIRRIQSGIDTHDRAIVDSYSAISKKL